MSLGIPKRLAHIWVGHKEPPIEWMNTWRHHHPDWEYVLYDNNYLTGRQWRNQSLINTYFKQGRYEGVSDLIRYEILLHEGGFVPEADAECLMPCDALFEKATAYTVYENEFRKPGLVSPFIAASPGHPFLETIVTDLGQRWTPDTLKVPWRSTGNKYLKHRISEHSPDIVIFPSHFFIPEHKSGVCYDGDGPIYARQHWGTTGRKYSEPDEQVTIRRREAVLQRLLER